MIRLLWQLAPGARYPVVTVLFPILVLATVLVLVASFCCQLLPRTAVEAIAMLSGKNLEWLEAKFSPFWSDRWIGI